MGDVPADDYGRPGFTRRFGNSNSSSLGNGLSFWDRDFRSEHYPVGKRQNSTKKNPAGCHVGDSPAGFFLRRSVYVM